MFQPGNTAEMARMLNGLQQQAEMEAMTELSEVLADAQLLLAMEERLLRNAREAASARENEHGGPHAP